MINLNQYLTGASPYDSSYVLKYRDGEYSLETDLWVYKPEGKENIRCLCPKCLNDYIHNPDYIVRRLDPFAKRKDRCDKCDGDGWDYVVTDRYSSKKEKRGSKMCIRDRYKTGHT